MKLLNLIHIPILIIVCVSCKKSEEDNRGSEKLKSVTFAVKSATLNSTQTNNIVYNSSGEIIGLESITFPGNRSVYEISGTKNSSTTYNSNNLFVYVESFVDLNSALVDSTYEINYSGKDTTATKYYYNDTKQLVKSVHILRSLGETRNGVTNYEYDGSGNLSKEVISFPGSVYSTTYAYEITVPLVKAAPDGLYPVKLKKMPTKVEFRGPGTDYDVLHTYTLDAQGRLSSDVFTFSSNDRIHTNTYTYY